MNVLSFLALTICYSIASGNSITAVTDNYGKTYTNIHDPVPISCGETKSGTRASHTEMLIYEFTATGARDAVFLEGCNSGTDIWLYLFGSNGQEIYNADDQRNHGDQAGCGNFYAGDITVTTPSNKPNPVPVSAGQKFYFGVGSYSATSGHFSVTLECNCGNPSAAKLAIQTGAGNANNGGTPYNVYIRFHNNNIGWTRNWFKLDNANCDDFPDPGNQWSYFASANSIISDIMGNDVNKVALHTVECDYLFIKTIVINGITINVNTGVDYLPYGVTCGQDMVYYADGSNTKLKASVEQNWVPSTTHVSNPTKANAVPPITFTATGQKLDCCGAYGNGGVQLVIRRNGEVYYPGVEWHYNGNFHQAEVTNNVGITSPGTTTYDDNSPISLALNSDIKLSVSMESTTASTYDFYINDKLVGTYQFDTSTPEPVTGFGIYPSNGAFIASDATVTGINGNLLCSSSGATWSITNNNGQPSSSNYYTLDGSACTMTVDQANFHDKAEVSYTSARSVNNFNFDWLYPSDGQVGAVQVNSYIVWIVIALLVVNIICLSIHCWNNKCKSNKRGYKVVKYDSEVTDV